MKLLSFLFVFLFSFYTQATYIEIEDENDVVRVYNTIHHFWRKHSEQKKCLVESINKNDTNFENEESRKALEQIKRSKDDLIKLAKANKEDFFSDLINDIKYIKENKELVTQILEEEKKRYIDFYTELVLSKYCQKWFLQD